jgi:hypothetical protein
MYEGYALRLTNKYDIPSVFENFDKANGHTTGGANYSVTSVIDSPQISRLRKKHHSEMEKDMSDVVFSILGTAVHAILEGGASEGQIPEQRLHCDIDVDGRTVSISGQIDLQTPTEDGYMLSDYKTTSVYAIQANPDGKVEYVNQLNSYAAIARRNGVNVSGLEVIAILRDWSAAAKSRSENYPQASVVVIPVDMWSEEKADRYLEARVKLHESLEHNECTLEEMWAKPPVFALYELAKSGTLRKRATKLFDNKLEADIASSPLLGSVVVERPRMFTRCEGDYCNVSKFCEQYKSIRREDGRE